MIALSNPITLTPEEYTIALNLALLIRNHLRGSGCRVYFADIKARIEKRNLFYYPDILITCNPQDRETSTYKSFPKLIVESINLIADFTNLYEDVELEAISRKTELTFRLIYFLFSG